MSFSLRDKACAKAIISIFETDKIRANYSALAVLKDGAGISYGAHQATHRARSLYNIVKLYTEISQDSQAKDLKSYLPLLNRTSVTSVSNGSKDEKLKSLLKSAGKKEDMQYAQEYIFNRDYLEPAIDACSGFKHPLSLAAVYDSKIQGSFTRVRDRVNPSPEKTWVKNYCIEREKFLRSSSKQVVRNSVYRPQSLRVLIEKDNWELATPFTIRGHKVTEADLDFYISVMKENSKNVPDEQNLGSGVLDVPEADLPEKIVEEELPNEAATGPEFTEAERPIGDHSGTLATQIEPNTADTPTGSGSWVMSLRGWYTSLGIGSVATIGSSVYSFFSDKPLPSQAWKIIVGIIAICLVAALIIWILTFVGRQVEKFHNRRIAALMTLKEMEIRSDPNKFNVEVRKSEPVLVDETERAENASEGPLGSLGQL